MFKELSTGHLERVLTWLPREQWFDPDILMLSLNHDGNAKTLARLVICGAPLVVTMWDDRDTTLLHLAKGRILEELSCVAPSLQITDGKGQTPLSAAINLSIIDSAAILMTHGSRISTVPSHLKARTPADLWALEKAILRCRSSTVALLKLKHTGKIDFRWDKYLIAQIARVVWASRRDDAWVSDCDAEQLKICNESNERIKILNAELQRLHEIVKDATFKIRDQTP